MLLQFMSRLFTEILDKAEESQFLLFKESAQFMLKRCMEIGNLWFVDQPEVLLRIHLQF